MFAQGSRFLNCWECALLACLLSLDQSMGIDLRTRGPPSVAIDVRSTRTLGHSQLQLKAPLRLWCQGVDANTMKEIPAKEVTFLHNGHKAHGIISSDGKNATYEKDPATVADAGIWTCSVRTQHGVATGDISVYLRPIVVPFNYSLRIDEKEPKHHLSSSVNTFEASGITVVKGDDARIECPVAGFPRPQIQWRNERGLVSHLRATTQSNALIIRNVTDKDEGLYSCSASNTYSIKGIVQHYGVVVERRLRVKSEYAWLLPLGIIIVTVVLLITTIALFELRKKRNEQKLMEVEEE